MSAAIENCVEYASLQHVTLGESAVLFPRRWGEAIRSIFLVPSLRSFSLIVCSS